MNEQIIAARNIVRTGRTGEEIQALARAIIVRSEQSIRETSLR